ncbi:MAG TPA: helix-turn-helix transcriptional regulator [Staphylococcus ureilyticus]|uniref:helix-turn-helix domain-containing protein n=1 Tax=Staphylococcus ureilyticus TaxID=94138 RepID=UPI001D7FD418|nr:helix-turn-helix transcriptional regulator [Staphylococcus ureilyticus]HJG68183.1 helix-turn-helix transcriptional regulator [Staphylococcus ureilyticus]
MIKNNVSSNKETMTIIDGLAFLRTERVKRGISQTELAKRLGMSQPQLAKIENLSSIPSLKTLNRYAKGLGYEIKLKFEPINQL